MLKTVCYKDCIYVGIIIFYKIYRAVMIASTNPSSEPGKGFIENFEGSIFPVSRGT